MSFIGSPSAFDAPRQPTEESSAKAEPLAKESTLQGIRSGISLMSSDLVSLNTKIGDKGAIYGILTDIADILDTSAIARHSDSPLETELKKITQNTGKANLEQKLETKVSDLKAERIEKNQTSLLTSINESFQKRLGESGIWKFLKENWGKMLLVFTALKLPLEMWPNIMGTLEQVWKFLSGPFLDFLKGPVATGLEALAASLFGAEGLFGNQGPLSKDGWIGKFFGKDLRGEFALLVLGIGVAIGSVAAFGLALATALAPIKLASNILKAGISPASALKAKTINKAHKQALKENKKIDKAKKSSPATSKLAKVAKGAATAGRGLTKLLWPLAAGMALWDAGSGAKNAGEILGKKGDLTLRDRLAGGAGGLLSGLTFGMLDKEKIAKALSAKEHKAIGSSVHTGGAGTPGFLPTGQMELADGRKNMSGWNGLSGQAKLNSQRMANMFGGLRITSGQRSQQQQAKAMMGMESVDVYSSKWKGKLTKAERNSAPGTNERSMAIAKIMAAGFESKHKHGNAIDFSTPSAYIGRIPALRTLLEDTFPGSKLIEEGNHMHLAFKPGVSPDQLSTGMNKIHEGRNGGGFVGAPSTYNIISNSVNAQKEGDNVIMSPSVHNDKITN
jgi:hypothetical protein